MSEKEKRVIEGYVESSSLRIGNTELILAEKPGVDNPYMVCNCNWNNRFGVDEFTKGEVSHDYLETLHLFVSRAYTLLSALEQEREVNGLPLQPLGVEHCVDGGMNEHLEDKLAIIKADCITPEFRSAEHQLIICKTGNGCSPTARGSSVYGDYLFSGKPTKWQREHLAGVADPAKLPEWAQQRLAEIQSPTKKSIKEQINDGKQRAKEQAHNIIRKVTKPVL